MSLLPLYERRLWRPPPAPAAPLTCRRPGPLAMLTVVSQAIPLAANTSASMAAAAASLSFTASAARRSVHVAPYRCHRPGGVPAHVEGDGLHLDNHARPPGRLP
jgi:hypothetical protein